MTTYQPRYVAYCTANGNTPDAQLEADRAEFPGGCMTGYILWIADRSREFAEITGEPRAANIWSDRFTVHCQVRALLPQIAASRTGEIVATPANAATVAALVDAELIDWVRPNEEGDPVRYAVDGAELHNNPKTFEWYMSLFEAVK